MPDETTHANTGSRARDHNERTYLAWVRTALGAIALPSLSSDSAPTTTMIRR